MDARLWPGRCSRCFQWLGVEKSSNEASSNEWRLWVAIQLGELLAAGSQASFLPSIESMNQVLPSILSQMSRVEIRTLCHLMQIHPHYFEQWQRRNSQPSLSVLAKMCYILDLSLIDLFCGRVPPTRVRIVRTITAQFSSKPKSHRRGAPINVEECKRTLQTALEEDPPVSVGEVRCRLGMSRKGGYLSKLFPELCDAVAERYSDFRKSMIAERKREAIAEVKRVTREMYAAGISLHYRKISPRLTLGGMYIPEGRIAFRQIKEELGVELR